MRPKSDSEPIGLDAVPNDFYQPLIRRIIAEHRGHYRERLVSVYLSGSVHRGEASTDPEYPSDLDLVIFLTDPFNEADRAWRSRVNDELEAEFPGFPWNKIPVAFPVSSVFPTHLPRGTESPERQGILDLRKGRPLDADARALKIARYSQYLFRYDATLLWGRDLTVGTSVLPPDRLWALAYFQQPWDLARHAAGFGPAQVTAHARENVEEWPLPVDASLRLRKLARLAVLGGAYLLMAHDRFCSFRGADVLPALEAQWPQWTAFLQETERLYKLPTAATPESVGEYLSQLVPWMDWAGEEISQG